MLFTDTWDEEKQCKSGECLKDVQVPSKLTSDTLKELVHIVIKVNASKLRVVLLMKYKLDFDSLMAVIEDDDDVQFLLIIRKCCEGSSGKTI